jgi:hypothetical protein
MFHRNEVRNDMNKNPRKENEENNGYGKKDWRGKGVNFIKSFNKN